MNRQIPRPEHPRPAFMRDSWVNLNGEWEFFNDLSASGVDRRLYEADRFDGELSSHQHLFCRRCKKVLNLAMQSDALEALVQSCPGIQAEDYNFIVTGLCPDCKQHPDAQGDASANS